jgi:hypothetical protein
MTLREELACRLATFTVERWQLDRAERLGISREESARTEPYYDLDKMIANHLSMADEVVRQMEWTYRNVVIDDSGIPIEPADLTLAPPDWKP